MPAQEHTPVARPKSLISGKNMKIEWSANWDDDLGGSTATAYRDPMLAKIGDKVKFEFEQTFDVLPAAHLRALPQPLVRRVLPEWRDLQARGGRHRPGGPGPLPRLADVCVGLPLQEGLLQPPPARPRSAPSASHASRSASRPSARRPAWAVCATSASCSMTPTRSSRLRRPPMTAVSTRPALRVPRPE